MRKAVFAGSFDPITNGHVYVMERALDLFDHVFMAVGVRPGKKYMTGSHGERVTLIADVLKASLTADQYDRVTVMSFSDRLTVDVARRAESKHLVRGIRNIADLTDEMEIQDVNRAADPEIETVYILPPPDLQSVRSSTIKGLVGIDNWEKLVSKFVHPLVMERLREINDASH